MDVPDVQPLLVNTAGCERMLPQPQAQVLNVRGSSKTFRLCHLPCNEQTKTPWQKHHCFSPTMKLSEAESAFFRSTGTWPYDWRERIVVVEMSTLNSPKTLWFACWGRTSNLKSVEQFSSFQVHFPLRTIKGAALAWGKGRREAHPTLGGNNNHQC